MVIDNLYESKPSIIWKYSTVSKNWLPRIRKHLFNLVTFVGWGDLNKWLSTFKVDRSGVSQYVRQARWFDIETLVNFKNHLEHFTKVEQAHFSDCGTFRSFDELEPLRSLGSHLVRLEIYRITTTPRIMASLREYFPRLCQLFAEELRFKDDDSPPLGAETPGITLFEGADEMTLVCGWGQPVRLDWISPTAQFKKLTVGGAYVREHPEAVNNLIASSGKSLTHICIKGTYERTHLDST